MYLLLFLAPKKKVYLFTIIKYLSSKLFFSLIRSVYFSLLEHLKLLGIMLKNENQIAPK